MPEDRKRIFIAIPSMDHVPVDFANSLSYLQKPKGYDWTQQFEVGSLIYEARNKLAKRAIDAESDYVFWLDSDMTFDPGILIRLMERMETLDADMLSGLYFRRIPPFSPVLFEQCELKDGGDTCEWAEFREIPGEPFEIAAAGFGCMLTKAHIYQKILDRYMQLFTPAATAGEDLAFCWRARQIGAKIYADPTALLGHVSKSIVDKNYFLAYQEQTYGKEGLDSGADHSTE